MFRRMQWFVAVLLVSGVCTNAALADLIGYWPFDEGQGTEASDIAENGNNGTLSGGVEWVPGYKGSGVRLDTAGERVVIGPIDPTAENNAMTLAIWINWEGEDHAGITHQGVFGKRQGWDPRTNVKWFWEAQPDGDLEFRNGDTAVTASGVLDAYSNEWAHVAMTWDDGAVVQYINAEEVGTGNITFRDTADATVVSIGCVSATSNETFVGSLDEARIYSHVLTMDEIQTIMLGEFPTAYSPNPADGAIHGDTWLTLSWKPGTLAISHDVYLGENLDDVTNGTGETFRGNQAAADFIIGFAGFPYPEGLIPGTTYYWRIDEVNDAHADSPWKGDVWSFSVPPKIAFVPVPSDGAESVALDVELGWAPGFNAILHTVYFGDDFDIVSNATGGVPQGAATYDPGPLQAAKTYYWRVDEFDPPFTHKGDVWSFATEGTAKDPNPAKGAVGVEPTPTLSWSPGNLAASHEVYFGEGADAVKYAEKTSPEYKGTKALGEESYDPSELLLQTTYYWRIDEVNSVNTDSPWTGNLWSFTTGDFFVMDDFEDYTDDDAASQAIWQSWIDGFGVATNGSQVGYLLPPYAEQTIVHGGSQSMPLVYNNTAGITNSEAALVLTGHRNWTEQGIAQLSIWFQGQAGSVGSFVEGPVSTFTMTGSGADIWTQADQFHFAYKTLTGAGEIIAKVESVEQTDVWAKAGVMIRETLDAGSKFAFVTMTPTNADGTPTQGCRFQARTDTDIDATSDTSLATPEQMGLTTPYWVKLERDIAGNFRGSYSSNGTTWQPLAWRPSVSMGSTVYVGLALTSHNAALTCEAVFSNVTITGTASGQWQSQDIGIASNAAEPLYVSVYNATGAPAVVANPDPAAASIDAWTEWVVPLQAFADQDINLADVDKIAIGLGNKGGAATGGSGTVYIDDIRLYRSDPDPQP